MRKACAGGAVAESLFAEKAPFPSLPRAAASAARHGRRSEVAAFLRPPGFRGRGLGKEFPKNQAASASTGRPDPRPVCPGPRPAPARKAPRTLDAPSSRKEGTDGSPTGPMRQCNRRREPQRGACYTESTRKPCLPPPLPPRRAALAPAASPSGTRPSTPRRTLAERAAGTLPMLTLDDSGLAQGPGPGARAEEAAVLAREVAWEPLLTARLVGDRDLQYIKRYDKRDLATRRELLAEVRHPPPPPRPRPRPRAGGGASGPVRPRASAPCPSGRSPALPKPVPGATRGLTSRRRRPRCPSGRRRRGRRTWRRSWRCCAT